MLIKRKYFIDNLRIPCILMWLAVAAAFFVVKFACDGIVNFALITLVSFAVTVGLYEICKRIAPLQFITGIKMPNKSRGDNTVK